LLFGGVPVRFPRLRFGFMEGGVAWAVSLRGDVVSHWEKRAGLAIDRYDPSRIDRRLVADLVQEYGPDAIRARADRIDEVLSPLGLPVADHDVIDEFAESALDGPDAIHRVFRDQFFAGCEADDPLIFLAFDDRLAAGMHVGVLLGSDLGHWDAPDATQFLAEALGTKPRLRPLTAPRRRVPQLPRPRRPTPHRRSLHPQRLCQADAAPATARPGQPADGAGTHVQCPGVIAAALIRVDRGGGGWCVSADEDSVVSDEHLPRRADHEAVFILRQRLGGLALEPLASLAGNVERLLVELTDAVPG